MDDCWVTEKYHLIRISLLLSVLVSQHAFADIAISGAYILAGPPTASAHAAYFSIHNSNKQSIVLRHINSEKFGAIEIHRSILSNEIFSMEHLESVTTKPESTVQLKPGGMHLMLFRANTPLKRGEQIEMELIFEKADSIRVSFPVRTPADL